MSAPDRRAKLVHNHPHLSVRRQCAMLGIARSAVYRVPRPANDDELRMTRRIDELFTQWPFLGSRRITAMLRADGPAINRRFRPLKNHLPPASLPIWSGAPYVPAMDEEKPAAPLDIEAFATQLLDEVLELHPRYQTDANDARAFIEQVAEDRAVWASLRVSARSFLKQMKEGPQPLVGEFLRIPTGYGGAWKSSLDF
jgi:hypothetical protein